MNAKTIEYLTSPNVLEHLTAAYCAPVRDLGSGSLMGPSYETRSVGHWLYAPSGPDGFEGIFKLHVHDERPLILRLDQTLRGFEVSCDLPAEARALDQASVLRQDELADPTPTGIRMLCRQGEVLEQVIELALSASKLWAAAGVQRPYDEIGETWRQRRDSRGNAVVVELPDETMRAALAGTLSPHEHPPFAGWFGTEEMCPVCSCYFLVRPYYEKIPRQGAPNKSIEGPHLHVACVRCRDWASTNHYGQMKRSA